MKIRWLVFMILLVALTVGVSAQNEPVATEEVTSADCAALMLIDGWGRATVEGAPNGAAYGYVVNLGNESDKLIGGSTPAADVVEIHTMIMDGDVMRMRPVEGGLEIPPMGFAELVPGGYHIMLINLVAPLEAGSTLDLTLTFENAGDVELTIPVREFDVTAMGHGTEAQNSHHMDTMDPAHSEMLSDMPTMVSDCMTMLEGVHLVGAWARPAPEGTPTSAVYGLFVNLTDEDKTLVSAETLSAEAVELHQTTIDENDVMRMRPVEDGLLLGTGKGVLLKSGGLHIMLINPVSPLIAGESIELVLTFDDDSTATLVIPVVDPSMDDAHMGGHHSP